MMAEIKIHEFQVAMTCEGCLGAVQRVLNKFEGKGVDKVNIDLPSQKVEVTSTLSPDQIMDILKKTGKKVTYVKST